MQTLWVQTGMILNIMAAIAGSNSDQILITQNDKKKL